MDLYRSWICECSLENTPFRKCKLSVDYMSGCFFVDDRLLDFIKDIQITENPENSWIDFISVSSNKINSFRFKMETDLKEIRDVQNNYIQQFSSQKTQVSTTYNEYTDEMPSKNLKGKYSLKSSRPPNFTLFTIYRTLRFMYIVAKVDAKSDIYRLLKIELASNTNYEGELSDYIFDDGREYDKQSISTLLTTIRDGNKATGGLTFVCVAKALLGFVRFTRHYYLTVATEVKAEGVIMGHIVYSISSYDVIPLSSTPNQKGLFSSILSGMSSADELEEKNLGLFNMVDLSKGFFFSYNYCLSYSSQINILKKSRDCPDSEQSMFVWNDYLLSEFREIVSSEWYVSLIQGVFLQKHCVHHSHHFQLSLIARRSREYAGPRYLKRGINDDGYVANEVEVETLIEDDEGHICSHVQLRGSIPGYWKQDVSVAVPRPPIQIVKKDPIYRSFMKHMSLLFERYSAPIQVIDLVKIKEKHPRETLVHQLLQDSCQFANKKMPLGMKISYNHFDFADIAKRSSVKDPLLHDILLHQSKISLECALYGLLISSTHFFATYISPDTVRRIKKLKANKTDASILTSGAGGMKEISKSFRAVLLSNNRLEQRGIMRSNCIDCLDRTNVSQYFLSFTVVYRMLFTLGIELSPEVPETSPLQRLLIDMYKELGDIISIHYGGSNAHDKIEITKGSNNKKRKEIFTTILRHYNNTFTDKIKQESYNVFLGIYRPHIHQQLMNDMTAKGSGDYYLHNRGFLSNTVQMIPEEKWWFHPLCEYEEKLKGDIYDSLTGDGYVVCPSCKATPQRTDIFLCPSCGAILQRSLPALDPSSYYEFKEETELRWDQLGDSPEENGLTTTEQLMAVDYMQPHITTPGMNQQGSEVHPEMWNNWNSRTFVANTKKKVHKNAEKQAQVQDDEDEDEVKSVPSEAGKATPVRVNFSPSEVAVIEETDNEPEPMKRLSGKRSPGYGDVISEDADLFREYCVFPSHSNVPSNVYMLYDKYSSFKTNLEKSLSMEQEQQEQQEQEGDKALYESYLEESRMESTLNTVTCSMQQQDMYATYRVKYGDEEYERDDSCCFLLNDEISDLDVQVYKQYAGVSSISRLC